MTGRLVLAVALGAFGIVIAVNLVLVFAATRTFPGLVVPNSYVASQDFDRSRVAQEALGWSIGLSAEGGAIVAAIRDEAGRPVPGLAVTVRLARPASDALAEELVLRESGDAYRAEPALAPGPWRASLSVRGPSGEHWQGEARFVMRKPAP